jgi:hypothetical protein
MDELTDVQRLAVAQAVYKAVSGVVSTKDEDSLRSECDRVLVEQYEQTGAKSYDVPINGMKVGTYSVKVSKAKPKRKAPRAWVDDWDEFTDWLTHDDGADWLRSLVEEHGDALALEILHETGEIAPGCVAQLDYCEPAEPPRATGTTLRIDMEAMHDVMRPMLGDGVTAFLEGEQDA